MSASGGLCGAASVSNSAFAANNAFVGNVSGRDSPASSSSSSNAGASALPIHQHVSTSGVVIPPASGINSLGLLDAAVVAELERTSLQSLVSCVDAAMAMGSGARTMDAAVVAELERTSLHSLVSVMDASMHMHQNIAAHNSPK